MSKMYTELAHWWPLLSPPAEYADEAATFGQLLVDSGLPPEPALLELGCGGGNNAVHLKTLFAHVTLTDLSPDMLALSRSLNPDCTHVVGDMRTLRLERTFDAVFIHDAIEYMTTPDDLRQAIETAFVHCTAGGVALFVPDQVRETFQPDTSHGGSDGPDRAMRYLEWSYDPDPTDMTYVTEYVFILREGAQIVGVEHDQHIHGLFARDMWLQTLRETGFEPTIVVDQYERELFVAHKPRAS